MPLKLMFMAAAAAIVATAAAGLAEPAPVDESGLRYFAREGDMPRLAAEIARLKALHPGWTPPADPLSTEPAADAAVEAIWTLIGAGKAAEARAAAARLGDERPGWQAPPELLERLALAEDRARLVNASELKQWATVVATAAENAPLLGCNDVEVLWRLAEAFAATERPDRASDVYAYVLDNCPSETERIASLQKALGTLDRPRVDRLLLRVGEGAASPAFAGLQLDLARQDVAAAGAEGGTRAAPEAVARLKAAFAAEPASSDALLLAWASYRNGQRREAESWFRRAAELDDTADAALGVALSEIDRGDYAAAEATMDPWRDSSDQAEAVYLAAAANLLAGDPPQARDEATLARIVQATMEGESAPVAQQLGWYARAFRQPKTAADWFATALGWDPASEAAAFGLALARRDLGDAEGVAALVAAWGARSPRIAALGGPVVTPSSRTPEVAATQARPAQRAAPAAAARAGAGGACGGGDALAQGWCLMEANRPLEAARAFARAGASGQPQVRSDAAYGESLAYLREGLTDQAAVAALKAPLSPGRQAELQASILSDRAVAAFRHGRYADALVALDQRASIAGERVDLMVLRGHAYLKLGRRAEARRAFEAGARTGDPKAREGLLIVNR